MATKDEFLALLHGDSNVPEKTMEENDFKEGQCQDSDASESWTPGATELLESTPDCKLPPLNISMKLKNHTRSRSELPRSLPLTLSEQLLLSYTKPKRNNVQFATDNAKWDDVSAPKQVHPLQRILSEESDDMKDQTVDPSSKLLAVLKDTDVIKNSPPHRRSKTLDLDTTNKINVSVGGRIMPAEDLIKLTNLDLAAAAEPIVYGRLRPLYTPRRVYQNNFIRGKGNAIQAAVASIFGLTLLDVPNFVEMPDKYDVSIGKFYSQRSEGKGRCIRITFGDSTCKETSCKGHNMTLINSPHTRRKRSPEELERVAAIGENCMSKLYSVLNDDRMTMAQLEGFNRRLNELVQGTLLSLNMSGSCNCMVSRKYDVPGEYNDQICILRGKSPRGDFGHTVVARHLSNGKFEMLHDPYPDGDFLDGKMLRTNT